MCRRYSTGHFVSCFVFCFSFNKLLLSSSSIWSLTQRGETYNFLHSSFVKKKKSRVIFGFLAGLLSSFFAFGAAFLFGHMQLFNHTGFNMVNNNSLPSINVPLTVCQLPKSYLWIHYISTGENFIKPPNYTWHWVYCQTSCGAILSFEKITEKHPWPFTKHTFPLLSIILSLAAIKTRWCMLPAQIITALSHLGFLLKKKNPVIHLSWPMKE